MAFLFHSSTPTYADEQLSAHLSSLSTLPINLPQSSFTTSSVPPSPRLQSALQDLSSSRPISKEKLIELLESLASDQGGAYSAEARNELDGVLEAEVIGRAVTVVWKEVMQVFVEGALKLEEERAWWDASLSSRRGVGIYLIQTMPHRLLNALSPKGQFTFPDIRNFHFPSRNLLFKPLHSTTSAALTSLTSPYALTRREMLSAKHELTHARDRAARRVGILASHGPGWVSESRDESAQSALMDITGESTRLYSVLCQVLEVPLPSPRPSKRSRSSAATSTPPPTPTPATLLALLRTHLPQARVSIDKTVTSHGRPSRLTRLWFPFLFLPPTLYFVVSAIARNKEWMKEQVRNAKETVKGFFVQWVWEPMEGIGKTLRGGGEGLGVAPTTVQSDQASLERMVIDLGRDYYHLSGPALEALGEQVKKGDMEQVLRVYEKEMQSPVKSALMGSLIRTLLIQVQKTKTDLSLSLLSLDHLLRSQQLTFAFVGVAPSVLVLYGLGGWLQGVWKGEKRGKGRKRAYFNGLRSIERLLITSPKDAQEMPDRDRGLLIVNVSGMRTWATGLAGSARGEFMDDLRMVEDPALSRGDKLRVVERIWRCWGVDGRRKA
ncbi:hypothetical protein IAT38_005321 [Cryptococcus sp. DSM 104549]